MDLAKLEIRDSIAILTLARPDAGNALNRALVDSFASQAERIAASGVRAILLRAEGRAFCVGGDIREFAAAEDRATFIGNLAERLHQGLRHLTGQPAPIVVAVHGAAAGAGLSLAAAGDIVLAARSASFSMAYTGIGLSPDGGATWTLPRLIGLRRAQEMALTNRRLDAAEAQDWGLVTRVVDDEALAEEALAMARTLAAGPTMAYGRIRRQLAETEANSFEDQLDIERSDIAASMASKDAQEGVDAFIARRKPHFTGG